eukprot:m.126227 g.126227  ORF g.126227 m.126227 type:complete len:188 (-) comp13823_c1_seq2:3620-4183(-)
MARAALSPVEDQRLWKRLKTLLVYDNNNAVSRNMRFDGFVNVAHVQAVEPGLTLEYLQESCRARRYSLRQEGDTWMVRANYGHHPSMNRIVNAAHDPAFPPIPAALPKSVTFERHENAYLLDSPCVVRAAFRTLDEAQRAATVLPNCNGITYRAGQYELRVGPEVKGPSPMQETTWVMHRDPGSTSQ